MLVAANNICQQVREAVLISSLWVAFCVFSLEVRSEIKKNIAAGRINYELPLFCVDFVLNRIADLHRQYTSSLLKHNLGAALVFSLPLSHQPENKGVSCSLNCHAEPS